MPLVRLQRFLSQTGVASRRKAEELILKGEIGVNEVPVREMGAKIDPAVDRVTYRGKTVGLQKSFFYFLLHKPIDVVVTKKDPEGRKTVYQMIPRLDSSVHAVGRLDRDSEGLLFLTNDGELTYRLTHPSYEVEKVYEVRLKGLPPSEAIKKLEKGIELEEEKTAPAKIRVIQKIPEIWVSVRIHEGKKRQVRRMFEAVGSKVLRLIRVKMGPVELGNLPAGKWRALSGSEVKNLKKAVGLEPL